ncbi:MAG: alcohol dehydrogenase catalytic domain-containing protein [Thermoleophilaceae bacterium]|nr:alcohol dehydrogenase catalytic domain-containing protein [Thermoleophilaceae bacterium]
MDRVRHRPRGWVRHYARVLAPAGAPAGRVALERDGEQRLRRLADAAADRARQRLARTRPSMRALTALPGGRLCWRSVPVPPPPGPDGAIVHPIAVATCDMDPLIALGSSPFPLPLHLGHESVAEVLTVGERVAGVRPGERVIVPFQISCGRCPPCRSGRTGNCAGVPPISMYGFGVAGGHWGGAYSDQLAVPYADAMLVPLPDGVDPVVAASVADNVCDGYRHVAPHLPGLLERDPEAEVLIVGSVRRRSLYGASVPLYAGLVAKALGARNVRFADSRPPVRAQAERLGLDVMHPQELRRRAPAPLVVDVSGSPAGQRTALSNVAPDGVCSSAGGLHRTTRIPASLLYGRNATFHVGRTHVRTLIPQVLDLMVQMRLRPEAVTTTVARLDEAPGVLREHYVGGGIKAILTE